MRFPYETSFEGFKFGDNVDFSMATFGDVVDFSVATFGDNVDFSMATFGDVVDFSVATFGDNVDFRKAKFGNSVYFNNAMFGDGVEFNKTTFGDKIYFRGATFGDVVDFSNATFGDEIEFSKARFGKRSYFNLLSIKGYIDFGYSSFIGVPSFITISEDDKLKLNVLNMSVGRAFEHYSDVTKLQQLKGIADSTNAVNEARDCFILQRKAERKFAWQEWRETLFHRNKKTTAFPLPKSIMAGLFWILSDYGRSVVRPIGWLLLSIPLFYYLYRWLYPVELKMVAQRDALIDYTLSSSIPFGRMLNPAFDRAFEWLFPKSHHQIIGTVDITIGFQIASIAQGIVSVILLFLIGLSIRNYFKIS